MIYSSYTPHYNHATSITASYFFFTNDVSNFLFALSAVEVGTEMLELDCHLTRNGHVIVSHDENLLRQTGLDANISDLDLEVRS